MTPMVGRAGDLAATAANVDHRIHQREWNAWGNREAGGLAVRRRAAGRYYRGHGVCAPEITSDADC